MELNAPAVEVVRRRSGRVKADRAETNALMQFASQAMGG